MKYTITFTVDEDERSLTLNASEMAYLKLKLSQGLKHPYVTHLEVHDPTTLLLLLSLADLQPAIVVQRGKIPPEFKDDDDE